MTNVASLELCKELEELSRWNDSAFVFFEALKFSSQPSVWEPVQREQDDVGATISAYDLGYLLRKLPEVSVLFRQYGGDESWRCHFNYDPRYANYGEGTVGFEAGTPEDAACKLAIELIKAGIIK